mgnify:CR=1 FL=1
MRHLLLAAALAGAGLPALAGDEVFCDKPEYLMLKEASRGELDEAYCSARLRHIRNQGFSDVTQDFVRRSLAEGAPAEKQQEQIAAYGKAIRSCISAAGAYEDALRRRFKAKPNPLCVKGE